MKVLAAGLATLAVAAGSCLAQAQPTLRQMADEARAASATRMTGIDAEGRLYGMGEGVEAAPRDEMSALERLQIMETIATNRERLIGEGKLAREHPKALTNFAWPLRFAAGRTDLEFHAISAYVDENPAFPDKLLDYFCGARTYDLASGYNHQGTDIFLAPFSWRKMDDEDVVIAAGAPGTIVGKSDGNFDRSCGMNNATWNAVYVQHADGSVAWYGHMKNGSPTVKGVGETVVTGEYLGMVGSSGSSTGPHLHLELYDPSNALVDPWLGACNSKSKQVTWAQQRAYRDTGVNALTIGTAPPDLPACPNPETSFATDFVTAGTTVYFAVYVRDQVVGAPISIRILRPNGTVFAAPAAIAGGDFNYRYAYWFYSNFPNTPGTWTLEGSVGGKSYLKTFQVGGSANFGAPASIAALSGGSQVTAPGLAFAAPLRVRVLDSLARPVKGAKVSFVTPAAGATVVLESRTALTDAAGIASVSALANATAGAYSVTASVAGAGAPVSFPLQNALAVVNGVSTTPAVVDFGGQSMNTTAPVVAVTLKNVSAGLLTPSVTAPANFTVAHSCGTLAAGASCVANVAFTPTAQGAVAGFLAIQSAAGTTNATVTGVGEKSLVTHYYRSILRRAPDGGGKTYWEGEATRVAGLGANVNEVWFAMAQAFYFSAEYAAFNRDNTGYATDLYNTFFNRAPDGGGLAFWKGQLDAGLPREVALAAFMFSAEFTSFTGAIFGSAAVRAEVDTVVDFYRGVLARTPDSGGFNFWVGRFRAAQCQGQAAVTNEVEAISSAYAVSAEYAARARNNSQYVGDLYNAFLRRGGDLGGVNFWIGQVNTGAQTREQVRAQFKNSPEFQARVNAIIAQGCLP